MSSIRVKKLSPKAILPTYGSVEAAGADLYACLEEGVTIQPGETVFIPTGIALEVPKGCAGLVYARSSMGAKRGLAPANKVGVIDSDYRGEYIVALHNDSSSDMTVSHGDRIAQLVVMPYLSVEFNETDELDSTARGTGGFGSTGK